MVLSDLQRSLSMIYYILNEKILLILSLRWVKGRTSLTSPGMQAALLDMQRIWFCFKHLRAIMKLNACTMGSMHVCGGTTEVSKGPYTELVMPTTDNRWCQQNTTSTIDVYVEEATTMLKSYHNVSHRWKCACCKKMIVYILLLYFAWASNKGWGRTSLQELSAHPWSPE